MLISLFYEFALWILALFALPKFLWDRFVKGKYQESFSKRLGKSFPVIYKGNRPLIWIHAVSVGEVKAISSLARLLKQQPDHPLLIISSITETGHAEAKRCLPEADYHVYLPFDFYGIIAPIIRKVKPDKVILCETDFWYNFLRSAKKQGAEIFVVNGKLSERSLKRFKWFSFFSQPLFSMIDRFCLQSPVYAERFLDLGIPKNKIVVTGNLKFENQPKVMTLEELCAFRADLRIDAKDQVIVIGSTHDPEEEQLLDVIKKLLLEIPSVKVIIVPRHPERFNGVERIIQASGLSYRRYSDADRSHTSSTDGNKVAYTAKSVILLDAMGMLNKCYQIASIAIVAGSYTPLVGGHNILEPLWFGVPVIYGPYMHSQPDLVEAVSSFGAGLQIQIDELKSVLQLLLQEKSEAEKLRQGAGQLIAAMQGSTERTFEAITL